MARSRDYRALFAVGALTGVVRWFQMLALGVYTLQITDSPFLVSTIPLLFMLPLALFGPVFGAVADRVSRTAMLAISMGAIAVVCAAMTWLAWNGPLSYEAVAVAAFLSGVFWASDMPVRRRVLGDVSGPALATAMGLDAATSNATRMLGPLLGGVTLQFVGVFGVFLAGAVVYLGCMLLTLTVRPPDSDKVEPTGPAMSLLRDLIAGIRFVAKDPGQRRFLAITLIFNMWGFPITSMIPVLGRDHLGLDPFGVGVLSSLEGLGALTGALLVAAFARPAQFFGLYAGGVTAHLCFILCSSLLFLSGIGGVLYWFGLFLVMTGIGAACFSATQSTLSYLGAPPAYRSRVLGVLTLCIGSGPIGFFNVGWMADLWGAPLAVCIMAVEGLVALALFRRFMPAPAAILDKD